MCPLDNPEHYFDRVRKKYPRIDKYFIEVLAKHRTPQEALSLSMFKDAYRVHAEIKFPPSMCDLRARQFLLTIPYIVSFSDANGIAYFYSLR